MQALWFFNTLVRVWVSEVEGQDGLSVLEHWAPYGDSPPLHIHHTEDEVFIVLEGEVRFLVGDTSRRVLPFEEILAPKGVPHTYRVESPEGARWVTVTAHRDFERFVRAMSRPAEREALPPPAGPPTPEEMERIVRIAETYGIEFVRAS
ncbi:cupin domain-containing protein [Thermus antranikianii]|uniref:Cupin domain-containing protein n=1 Tax=Thermus antranikianii TaxID=88190 RepID=A0ABY7RQU9_9DEIN|nr:cupin domain-containing protein [Thermus antranikianii]QWK21277.1 MAG: cupin domain-containing protein [Thermus antranikianii]WCM39898.1 cupin domain-containing protein [Thermus antranikianii]